MDFGFGRFLEMFEERFGRRWTTALLALISLAVASWCAATIYSDALVPIWQVLTLLYLSLKSSGPPLVDFVNLLAKIVGGISAVAIVLFITTHFPREAREARKLKEAIKLEAAIVELERALAARKVRLSDPEATNLPAEPLPIPTPQDTQREK